MRADPLLTFLDLPAGKLVTSAGHAPVPSPGPLATSRARHRQVAGTAR
jgi:hypothetical protein